MAGMDILSILTSKPVLIGLHLGVAILGFYIYEFLVK